MLLWDYPIGDLVRTFQASALPEGLAFLLLRIHPPSLQAPSLEVWLPLLPRSKKVPWVSLLPGRIGDGTRFLTGVKAGAACHTWRGHPQRLVRTGSSK